MKTLEHLELAHRNGHGVRLDPGEVGELVGKLRAADVLKAGIATLAQLAGEREAEVDQLRQQCRELSEENEKLIDNAHWLTCVKGDLELKLQHSEEDNAKPGSIVVTREQILQALSNHSSKYCWDDLDVNAALDELFKMGNEV